MTEPIAGSLEPNRPLTARERAFIPHYVETLNASEAARRAGYSEANAKHAGYKLLGKPIVRDAIAEALKARHMTPEEALARLEEHARATLDDFLVVERLRITSRPPVVVARAVALRHRHAELDAVRTALERAETNSDRDRLETNAVRLELEIARLESPDCPPLVTEDGPEIETDELVQRVDLDRAEREGKLHLLRSVKHTAHGLAVELHDVQAPLVNILKLHGKFIERHDLTTDGSPLKIIVGLQPDDL